MKTRIGIVFLIFSGLLLTHIRPLFAQPAWGEVNVANVLSFRFPPTLEVRDLDNTIMRVLQDGVNQLMVSRGGNLSDYQVTLQPQGFSTQGSPLYARVIVNIHIDSETTGTELNGLTNSDIKEANEIFKEQFTDSGMKGTWLGTSLRKFDGRFALVSRYNRAGLNGDVHVEEYRFFLKNYLVEVTMSYRKSEFDHWNNDFTKIPLTFKFY